MTAEDLATDAERIEAQIKSTLEALKLKLATLDDATSDAAGLLLSRRPELIRRARSIAALESSGQRIRIHGDYHLGQTLAHGEMRNRQHGGDDFVLIDFEGEPARPIEERRRKQSPLKDVAGMMRSFSYVAFAAVDHFVEAASVGGAPIPMLWPPGRTGGKTPPRLSSCGLTAMLRREIRHCCPSRSTAQALLEVYLLEKALYEVLYELNHRPAWLRIPMNGILAL